MKHQLYSHRFCFLVVVAVIGSCTQARCEVLPAEISEEIAKSLFACDGQVAYEQGFVTRRDVNGDKEKEFVIDYSNATCNGSSSYWCGSIGCPLYVFAYRRGGFVEILSTQVQHVRFESINGRPAAVLSLHPSNCSQQGASPCEAVYPWNGLKFVEDKVSLSRSASPRSAKSDWIGRWGFDTESCTSSEGATIKITKNSIDLGIFEEDCKILKTEVSSGTGKLLVSCAGEGGKSRKTLNFKIEGNILKFTNVSFRPSEFVRCDR